MSVRQDTQTRYCSTSDVARYMRGFPNLTAGDDFPTESNAGRGEPSASDVQRLIEKWTARFDRRTGQSFRGNQIFNETHDQKYLYYWLSGHPVNLTKRNIITPLDASKGDKLEIWNGNKWVDWVSSSSYQEGRNQEYWVDAPVGIIYVYERAILRPHPKFRISYRYGNTGGNSAVDSNGDHVADYVPADVRDAVASASAADIIESDTFGTTVPGNSDASNSDPGQMAQTWYDQFHRTVKDYKKLHFV